MKQVLMSQLAVQVRGVSYKPDDLHSELNKKSIILLRANNIDDGKINFDDVVYVDRSKVSDNQLLRNGDILICASSGSKSLVGKAAQVDFDGEVTFGAFCKVVRPTTIESNYLGMYFQSPTYRLIISALAQGANINNIKNENINTLLVNVPAKNEQTEAVKILKKVQVVIHFRQQQLQKLDELVKARFIELFGDPVRNSMGLPTEPMTTVCAIIDGDRGKNYPKQDEFSDTGYCLFLNAKNVTATGFSFENRMFITKEKDNALHNGKLERGDVVLTTRGTLGNLAFYDDSVPFENVRINSGMVILRMNKSVMTEVFFMEQFKLQLQSIKGKIASGSAQPQIPISTMNKIRILLAPMALQEQFAAFVEQTDKSKVAVQKALDETQLLFDSLMQKYFE